MKNNITKEYYLDTNTFAKSINLQKIKYNNNLLIEFENALSNYKNKVDFYYKKNKELFDGIAMNSKFVDLAFSKMIYKQATKSSFGIEGITLTDEDLKKVDIYKNIDDEKITIHQKVKDSDFDKNVNEQKEITENFINNYAATMKIIFLMKNEDVELSVNGLSRVHKILFSIANKTPIHKNKYCAGEFAKKDRNVTTFIKNNQVVKHFVGYKNNATDEEIFNNIIEYINKLFSFIKNSPFHPVVNAAIMHGQLAGIHPFLDGNGRTIRLFCTKFLNKMISVPISADKEIFDNVEKYYSLLNEFHINNNYEEFINFIIQCYIDAFKYYEKKIDSIYETYNFVYSRIFALDIGNKTQLTIPLIKRLSIILSTEKFFTEKKIFIYDQNNKMIGDRRTYEKYINALINNNLIKEVNNKYNESQKLYLVIENKSI